MNRLVLGLFVMLTLGLNLTRSESPAATTHFQFRLPQSASFRLDVPATKAAVRSIPGAWLKAWREDGSTNFVEFGDRVVLQLSSAVELSSWLAGSQLRLARVIAPNLFILQAPDAPTAAQEAHRLAALSGVTASYPVMRRQVTLNGLYARRSNDQFFVPYFSTFQGPIDAQWPIENIDFNGTRLGIDLNVMAAWPYGSGQGVTVAVADTGIDLDHAELTNRLSGAPHHNFYETNAPAAPFGGDQTDPFKEFWTHGTSVAGLIAAEGNNGRGMIGVAPLAHVASWMIFTTNYLLVSDESLMEMYQYHANEISIQNHSWGSGSGNRALAGPTLLEQVGISNAVALGRNGLGAIMVRAGGNDRAILASTDDDGYTDSPLVVTVAAVNKNGRASSYSSQGASILVSAPGGGGDSSQGLFSLDLAGSNRGVNSGVQYFQPDLADYRWGVQGFIGTSASAPLVSGVAALLLSVNPKLSYRDVQQILLLSARSWDQADPDLVTNGAGLQVSHNTGFGIPDAGHAVWLAQLWSNRPPLQVQTFSNSLAQAIPVDALRVEVSGNGVPPTLASLSSEPGIGPHADEPTRALALVDLGLATNVPNLNLTNKGALIQRGVNSFADKINHAAQAGAAFAIIYNFAGDDSRVIMLETDYTAIPAAFIGNADGLALKALFQTNNSATARIRLQTADYSFHVSAPLICEHVGVHVQIDYPLRGQLRLTLLSPQGTRSVLQHVNGDTNAGPADWTFWSTHHFFESSQGDWKVSVAAEGTGFTGMVQNVGLILRGTTITDTDQDGLDDDWERARFGSLAFGPQDDPDGDGLCNAREQAMGTNPLAWDLLSQIDAAFWQPTPVLVPGTQRLRLSWPSASAYSYDIWGGPNPSSLSLLTTVPGSFPQTEWFAPVIDGGHQFFRVYSRPDP